MNNVISKRKKLFSGDFLKKRSLLYTKFEILKFRSHSNKDILAIFQTVNVYTQLIVTVQTTNKDVYN